MVNRQVSYLIDQLTDLPLNGWRPVFGDRMNEAASRLDSTEFAVSSPDGEVVVHMTVAGSIVDIDIDADFLVESTEESLSRVITDLIREGDRIRLQVVGHLWGDRL